jgi:hypothetical protein
MRRVSPSWFVAVALPALRVAAACQSNVGHSSASATTAPAKNSVELQIDRGFRATALGRAPYLRAVSADVQLDPGTREELQRLLKGHEQRVEETLTLIREQTPTPSVSFCLQRAQQVRDDFENGALRSWFTAHPGA